MTLEGLSFFGIYRLIVPKSPRYAHHYRSGIIGYLLFGPCGFHVTVCGIVFLYKHLLAAGVACPEELLSTYMHYFFLPAFILFWIFFLVLEGAHIIVFAKGKTPLPKWSFIFSMPFRLLLAKCVNVFGNHPIVNAIDCAWIHIACLWTFGGLLIVTLTTTKKLGGNS